MISRRKATTLPVMAFTWALAIAFGVALGCALPQEARALTIVYTNDALGEIEPCGCRKDPKGGYLRKLNLMRRLKDQEILQLDAGDALFPTLSLPEVFQAQHRLQAEYVIRSLNTIGQDMVVPGERDFAAGFAFFESLRAKAKFEFLAANLHRRDQKPFLKGSIVLNRKSVDGKTVRVAVIGIVGEKLQWPKEVRASSALDAARKQVAALRKKSDLVVVVSHQGLAADEKLARSVSGIDLIVGGHSQSFLQEPKRVGKTLIVQSSFRNQYIGVLPYGAGLKPGTHELLGLDEGYEGKNAMSAIVSEFKKAVAKLNSAEEERVFGAAASTSLGGPKYQTFVRCGECHYKQFDFWRKTRHANALESLLKSEQIRNKECLSCHSVGLGDPEGFKSVAHAAWLKPPASIMANLYEGDPVPQPEPYAIEELAHYMKAVHGAKSLKAEVKLRRNDKAPVTVRASISRIERAWPTVQCENCHQPGRDHPLSDSYSKAVQDNTCLKCHTPQRAPGWYLSNGKPDFAVLKKKRAMIACPAGELEGD